MRFVFQMSGYGDPALDEETVQLLEQRLEKKSRQVMPGMWSVTDKLSARRGEGPGRDTRQKRYRAYGGILVTLGALALITWLMEPGASGLAWAGGFALFCGVLELLMSGKKESPTPPVSCRREAASLLERLRGADWSAPEKRTELHFDETAFTVSVGGQAESVSYSDVADIFETEHAWLLIYGREQAILLQRKDLIEGDAEKFLPYLRENMEK